MIANVTIQKDQELDYFYRDYEVLDKFKVEINSLKELSDLIFKYDKHENMLHQISFDKDKNEIDLYIFDYDEVCKR